MIGRVTLVRTDISKEISVSIIRVTRFGKLGTLAESSNRRTLRNIPENCTLHSHRRENLKSYNAQGLTTNAGITEEPDPMITHLPETKEYVTYSIWSEQPFWLGNQKEKAHQQDLNVDKIIFKFILEQPRDFFSLRGNYTDRRPPFVGEF
jgi:hypothetical protein